jgi:hypothetical protein
VWERPINDNRRKNVLDGALLLRFLWLGLNDKVRACAPKHPGTGTATRSYNARIVLAVRGVGPGCSVHWRNRLGRR